MKTSELLRAALQAFEGGERWCQKDMYVHQHPVPGRALGPTSVEKMCSIGAIALANHRLNGTNYHDELESEEGSRAGGYVSRALVALGHDEKLDTASIVMFNDNSDRTFEDVALVFKWAIHEAEQAGD